MIKIQEHLNRPDAEAFLDILALNHWEQLNQKFKKDNKYKQSSIIEKCKKYLKETKNKRYLKSFANNNADIAKRHQSFFGFLLKSKCEALKLILISRPDKLELLKKDIFNILEEDDLYTINTKGYSQTTFGKLLSEIIFNYKTFRSSDTCKKLFTELNFTAATCPYCNDYKLDIVTIKRNSTKDTKLKAYLDLDHFYSKSQHPFFALSFFNLIPSCHNCNASEKGDKLFTLLTHFHPYYEAFEDFYKFRISLKTLLGDPIDGIFIDEKKKKPLDKTITDLNLDSRYNHNFSRIKKLADLFVKHKGIKDQDAFIELILKDTPVNRSEILKHERAKLNRDILSQFDIHNVLKLT